jgi:N-acetylated-alpha-linked acidic dipeptidase
VNTKAYAVAADPTEGLKLPTAVAEVPYLDFSPILNSLTNLEKAAQNVEKLKTSADAQKLAVINAKIYTAEQALLMTSGLPRRPWYKHSLYAPGFYTGYGVKTIPGVREAIEQKNWAETTAQMSEVAAAINRLATYLETL